MQLPTGIESESSRMTVSLGPWALVLKVCSNEWLATVAIGPTLLDEKLGPKILRVLLRQRLAVIRALNISIVKCYYLFSWNLYFFVVFIQLLA